MNYEIKKLLPGLYMVATPIGNARDITLRALDILASADLIAAEDTRTARKLMDIHGVPLGDRQVIAYHDHSGDGPRGRVATVVAGGGSVAYVSEAGTPLIADPGYALGRAVSDAGGAVFAAPGASAALAALAVSGLPTDQFAFLGFLPNTQSARQSALADLRKLAMTVVVYESPKRVRDLLADLVQVLGADCPVVVCRELTKKFEEVVRGRAGDVVQMLDEKSPRGEYVVLIGHAGQVAASDDDIRSALVEAMKTARVKDAANMVAGAMGLPKREVYQLALTLDRPTQGE